jgi:hypothetical protein
MPGPATQYAVRMGFMTVVLSRGRKKEELVIKFSVLTKGLPMVEVFPLEQAAMAYEKMMSAKIHKVYL